MRNRWRPLRVALAAVAIAVAATMNAWTPAAALECEGVVLDDGCLFTITGGDTPDLDDGYAVTNAHDVPFFDYVRARDVQSIGYPISQRWISGSFTFQAFQKVILQWDPGEARMNYYNTLDVLANRYPEVALPNVPPHQVLESDGDGDFASVARAHLALLDENAAIKERFLREPAWLDLYGLPIAYQEREVGGQPQGLQLLRTQRTVFEIWNVPAPGTTVGRVNLQNIPDKVKELDNVIIPDRAKALHKAPDPDFLDLIATLSWVDDGLTPLEQDAVSQLERVFAVSELLLRTLIQTPHDAYMIKQPSQSTIPEFQAMARLAEVPWIGDGLTPTERTFLDEFIFRAPAVPDLASLILQKNWIKDGVNNEEVDIIKDLMAIGYDERHILNQTTPGTGEATISYYILQMPFLDSIETSDVLAIRSLREMGWHDRNYLHTVVTRYIQQGGIANDHAKIISVLAHIVLNTPELLNAMLDPSIVSVDERTIVLPHTGPVILAVIRTRPGEDSTMGRLEEAVRFSEGFMKRPFPARFIALHVTEAIEPWGGQYFHTHIAMREGYDDRDHYYSDYLRSVIHHEVAHYYWNRCGVWVCEGAAVYFQMHAGVLGSEEREDLAHRCGNTTIQDANRRRSDCRAYLGAELLLKLHESLGERIFVRGLGRLYDSIGSYELGSCVDMESGLCQFEFAYMTDAAPEAVAVAERLIRESYFGEN